MAVKRTWCPPLDCGIFSVSRSNLENETASTMPGKRTGRGVSKAGCRKRGMNRYVDAVETQIPPLRSPQRPAVEMTEFSRAAQSRIHFKVAMERGALQPAKAPEWRCRAEPRAPSQSHRRRAGADN